MPEPIEIMRFTTEAMDALRSIAQDTPEIWQNPETDFEAVLASVNVTEYASPTGLHAEGPITMPSAEQYNRNFKSRADIHALTFRQNIPGITPAQIADPQMLAWLSCFHLLRFGITRWGLQPGSNLTKHTLDHYLPESGRSITDASVAGRTLWLSEIATRAANHGKSFTPQQVIDHFAFNPEDYHNCTSYYVMRSPVVLAEYVRALMTDAQGISREGSREVARDLNRVAGPRLLDSLDRKDIREIITSSVDRLMHQTKYIADRTKLRGRKNLQILSLGAGVQSTVMALMADQGYEGFQKPDFAIFADTGWEPKAVYKHLAWLEKQLSFPVIRVTSGNIREDVLRGVNPEGRRFIDMPVYVVKEDGKEYIGTRQCTKQYKLKPIHRYLREYLDLKDGRVAPKDQQVNMWLGLSRDEAARVKPSQQAWITLTYPLLEKDLSRTQLYTWFKERYPDRELPKSACIGCPYHTDQMWADMKRNDPESFQDAVNVEWAMQNVPQSRGALTGTAYLHKSRIPLNQVKFDYTGSQADAMQQECEGLCGI